MIQVCAWCQVKIRDVGGTVRKSADGQEQEIVSHGICPECRAEYFPKAKALFHRRAPRGEDLVAKATAKPALARR